MLWIIAKVLITSAIIVAVSEVGKLNSFWGSLMASIPLVSTLAMIWMYHEKAPLEKISAHSSGVFWLVLPSLPMFLLMPWLLEKKHWAFYPSLLTCVAVTFVLYLATIYSLKRLGYTL
ncbi:MAG TPA: DUF3147 family protein [Prosthecobacter sp.]